ncbi:EAL domain-containing protein [Lacticaseibacillus kribbianus]|uniref:EAL domain-containing protein n=1 Tax=Lacticaseibacillus kribbianus TaxID=2926292 RepID=UPI001CD37BD6|nr:EAL domain-containing protein [Lacticaseibacillus kribbianus]
MESMTFWAQPTVDVEAAHPRATSFELLARTRHGGEWELPANVEAMTPPQLIALVTAAAKALPAGIPLSVNLHPRQFVRPAFVAAIAELQAACPSPVVVELTEKRDPLVPTRELVAAAERYAALGQPIIVDDVGSGQNLPGLVEGLTPFAHTYKFALQDLYGCSSADLLDRLDFWATRADGAGVALVIEGVETADLYRRLRVLCPQAQMQGDYLAAAASVAQAGTQALFAPR